ncbi:MAG: DUF4012 domain-containing protein [Candidatus Kerfeldbacteria bacterium]|nr:DUF4012 domain-containing protein [Candidatus Kerfeldbacteria bacterium]
MPMRLFRLNTRERLDFLQGSGRRRPWWRRRRVAMTIAIVSAVLALLAIVTVPPAVRTANAAKKFQSRLVKSQQLLVAQRFDEARAELDKTRKALDDTRVAFRSLRWWRIVPLVGSNIRAGDDLLVIGDILLTMVGRVTDFTDDLIGPFVKRDTPLTLASLSIDDRTQILERLGEAEPTLRTVQTDLRTMVERLDAMPRSLVRSRVNRELAPLRENFLIIEEALSRAAPIARILPTFLGHGDQQTYLFLLQNNAELRPAGGFIGTYGIMKVEDGEIVHFTTENAYNLDNRAKSTLNVEPPLPLKLYNSAERWWFRDANWSPDFPTSAAKAAELYRLEGGREQLDGVLAVTPTFIEALIALTGPITVSGVEFTRDNFVDTLQDLTTFGYYRQGVAESERKEIIGALGQILLTRIYELPQTQWSELWKTMLTELTEKQVLLNFTNRDLQTFALEQKWGGAVESVPGDFLMLVDANVAALKTDPVVNRTIRYELKPVDQHFEATATITYEHTGDFTEKTTRYRTYLRVYVPFGSELITSDGADLTDRSDRPGQVTIDEEHGKTVFAAFKSIEPGTTEHITFTFQLPDAVTQQIAAGSYTLYLEKQAGTAAHAVVLSLTFDSEITAVTGIDTLFAKRHTDLSHETNLQTDRALTLHLAR